MEDIWQENTPQYDPYEDETQNKLPFLQLADELEPMTEVGNQYFGAEILLTRGNEMARDHVVAHSCDANGNIVGKANTNPILNTGIYQVEFACGNITKFISNVIAKSVYAQ